MTATAINRQKPCYFGDFRVFRLAVLRVTQRQRETSNAYLRRVS